MRSFRTLLGLVETGLTGLAGPGLDEKEVVSADWTLMIQSARRHRLTNLLMEGIRKLDIALPSRIEDGLQSDYYTNLAANIVLFDHAEALIAEAETARTPLALLKGLAFAGWIYASPAHRPMADLDVLVRSEDIDVWMTTATKLGYQWHERTDHAVSFCHSRSGTYLELHTSLTSCPDYLGIDCKELWAHSTPAEGWPEPARTLSPADHLLHLCLHASFQHGLRQPVINACDAYVLSQLPDLDWKAFLHKATRPRLAPLVYGGLGLSYQVLPNEPMRKALEALEPLVQVRQRSMIRELDLSKLLAPASESISGSPWKRFAWTPSLKDSLALGREILRAPETKSSSIGWSPVRRCLGLAYRHLLTPRCRATMQVGAGLRL